MDLPNTVWKGMLAQASQNMAVSQSAPRTRQHPVLHISDGLVILCGGGGGAVQILQDQTTLREISKILRINTSVCGAVGPLFVHQLSIIFMDLINLYTTYRQGGPCTEGGRREGGETGLSDLEMMSINGAVTLCETPWRRKESSRRGWPTSRP